MKRFASLAGTFLALASVGAGAQEPVVRAELDSAKIVVGQQLGLTLTVTLPKQGDYQVLPLPDTLTSHVEVVKMLRADTLAQGDVLTYARRYLVTSFDTGLQYVPPIPVVTLGGEVAASTNDLALQVINPFQNVEVDQQSGVAKIFDIHEAQDAPFQWRELLRYWPWLVAFLVVVGLIILYVYWRSRRKKLAAEGPKPAVPLEPAETTALRELERIRTEKIWVRGQVKEFYTQLTDTLRHYIDQRFGVSTQERTTSETVELLRGDWRLTAPEVQQAQDILELADYAKFAKHQPLPDENDLAVKKAVEFVNTTTEAEHARQASSTGAKEQSGDSTREAAPTTRTDNGAEAQELLKPLPKNDRNNVQ